METLANLFFILILLGIAFRTLDWLGEIFDDIFPGYLTSYMI